MLGGINNGLFFSGFGGFIVLVLLLIPLLIWIFPSERKTKDAKKLRRKLKRDLRRIKRK